MVETSRPRNHEPAEADLGGPNPSETRWPRLLRTWPRRVGALLVPPLLASAVAYFVPGIWSDLTGGEPVEVAVLTDLTSFESKVIHTGGVRDAEAPLRAGRSWVD
jgi:hypothetical protein